MNWQIIDKLENLGAAPDGQSINKVDQGILKLHTPDMHALSVSSDGVQLEGRVSLWWEGTPGYKGETVGYIGHFAASSQQSCSFMLEESCRVLAEKGCTFAIGPMDGNTWRSYRLISDRGARPLFFMEPDTPIAWSKWFINSGFDVLANYTSAINRHLQESLPRLERARERLDAAGVSIRSINLEQIEHELEQIYSLSLGSFSRNYLYSSIGKDEFMLMYQKVIPHLDPRFSYVAEHNDKLVGFIFAVPDLLEMQRTGKTDAIVGKTLAIDGSRQFAGLGGVLIAELYRASLANGYSTVIHALQHEDNKAQNFGGDNIEIIRRYSLYSRKL
ncbi:MAG TPA: GNAT family N-acetyltransferase [Geopsychrobacteraceae bacterium]|nr:GNAT family N-acetyltransferase [Geopsychrobacteraceae bacterium]